jgi:glycosyltransferase involved in cell wall biosynthesis
MEELPKITIGMPIWNRPQFIPLIIRNILCLDYPREKLEFFILDDSDEDKKIISNPQEHKTFSDLISPIKLNYVYQSKKQTIGWKRNYICKNAKHNLIAFMDSDDLYLPNYLKHSVEVMKREKVSCVGSNQMIFVYPKKDWLITGIQCSQKRMIHEATMLLTKKHFRATGGFICNSQGEGTKLVDGMNKKKIGLTEVAEIMVCVSHDGNTIGKEDFITAQKLNDNGCNIGDFDRKIIETCLGL